MADIPEKQAYRGKRLDSERYVADTDIDTDTEQNLPMMHSYGRAGAKPPMQQQDQSLQPQIQSYSEKSTEENMEKQEPVQPVGLLCWVGFGCTIFGLAALCIGFSSPYWVQAYPNSFNQFKNIGLWEVCMNNYMHHKDYSQEIYSGCWWVFNRDPKFWKLHEWLLPPWMIAVQVLVTGSLILFGATALTVAFLILHYCPIMNHEYHQTYALFAAAAMMFLNTLSTFVGATVYGKMCQDREWMPNPQFNFLSWGFGFYIISGIAAIGAGLTFYFEAKRAYEELVRREVNLAGRIMEAVGWDPNLTDQPPRYEDYEAEMAAQQEYGRPQKS